MSIVASLIVWFFGLLQVGFVALVVWLTNLGMQQLFDAEPLTMEKLLFILFFVYVPALLGREMFNDYLSKDKK